MTTGLNTSIAGLYGTLTLHADGSYSYHANANSVPPDTADVFVYTIQDADGDQSTTTLTIDRTDSGLVASDSEALVNEAGLATGSNAGDGSAIYDGQITPSGGAGGYIYTLDSPALGSHGNLVLHADGSYTYTLTSPVNGSLGEQWHGHRSQRRCIQLHRDGCQRQHDDGHH